MAAKKSGGRKYGKSAGKSVKSAMHRRKKGTLKRGKSGHGGKVTSRKQAIAIGLSEAREKGAKVPRKRSTKRASSKKSTSKRSTSKRSTAKKSSSKRSSSRKSTARKSTARKSTARKSSGRKSTRKRSS
ncbi:hypothetical protein J421_1046 [Gemmatirosa kalamazoonensis]|uniref:Uncharacterized protein n=1 Tax=Gemmatirosa kalamazoonensis TaxID=861299 RepID=W0RGQ7_9BACT|nr:DUF6496 domain-containing protein [Gemmatirosa kalamazoonensis]AHG88583.1 hypothetical protein J421_1046 [Gemmatirosa kalamazoonensis]